MRRGLILAASGSLLFASAACQQTIHVQTMAAPDARLTTLRTFRVLPVPQPRDGRARAGAYDPMVNNSITNRALRETITTTLVNRGYVVAERVPDFDVAVYASAHERLDVTMWDYGYPFWPWYRSPRPMRGRVTEYTEGTMVIDVIEPRQRELLWRGSASIQLERDPSRDVKALQKVAAEIVKQFPVATKRPTVAVHGR